MRRNRYCVVIVHFGKLPAWFDLWRRTAHLNPSFDFLVFQDQQVDKDDGNVLLINQTLDGINALPFMQENQLRCKTPYKLCDLRPLLASVLPDHIAQYEYWGWGDLDVLYGDLAKTIGSAFGEFDYIGTGRNGESGPLAFVRNCPLMNDMWRREPSMFEIVNSEKSFAADEKHIVRLFREYAKCNIEFRECLDDVPAEWRDGALRGVLTGRQYALFHFGSSLKHIQSRIAISPSMLETGFDISRDYRILPPASDSLEANWRSFVDLCRHIKRSVSRLRLSRVRKW